MNRRGFTLLELTVATLIMGIAVVTLLSSISASLRNASRLTDYDRAALAARRKMDELLLMAHLPRQAPIEGRFDPQAAGGLEGGWRAEISPFEAPPAAPPGSAVLERVVLEVWWKNGEQRRSIQLETFRRYMPPAPGFAGAGR